MPGAAPRRGCPLFYFFNQKIGRIKEEQGEVVACCCVPALWLGIHVAEWEGVSPRLLQPLSVAVCVYTFPSPAGAQGGLAQLEGWVGGQSCAEQLILVSVPVLGAFSPPCHAGYSPCLHSHPGISHGGRVVWSGKLCPALLAAYSQPFSSQMLYMK